MAKKVRSRKGNGVVTPKRLRKQLRKADGQLHKAQAKRARAQARVEARSIIADEIRAQLADADKAARTTGAANAATSTPAKAQAAPVKRAPRKVTRKPVAKTQATTSAMPASMAPHLIM